ncbi:hypothetical protein [Halobacillus andaensis]|uniref:hypothetical protein n=1 Tax=Halobacillus andaensis TaxID=1176239 RepID=UPI003D72269E
MNVRTRFVAIIVVLAVLIGAAGSYVGMQYFGTTSDDNSDQTANADQEAENFASLSEDEQKNSLKDCRMAQT